MKWVTRQHPKIDRIACPWLIARFIDDDPEFLFVEAGRVRHTAETTGAIPFDIAGVDLGHAGDRCSFDAFLTKYDLHRPGLQRLATIVRGADTGRLDLTPQSAGLYAISMGLATLFADDHELLAHGLVLYEALFAWCERESCSSQRLEHDQPSWRRTRSGGSRSVCRVPSSPATSTASAPPTTP